MNKIIKKYCINRSNWKFRKIAFLAGAFIFILIIASSCNESSVEFTNGDLVNTTVPTDNNIGDLTSEGKMISSMLVGNNVWYKNPSQQIWDLTAQCGITSLRIGGNNYNDNMPTKAELLDWVKKAQAMGAEPIMQVSQFATTSEVAALVKYFNIDKASGKAIKYWNIGNEPWLKLNQPATSSMGAAVETYFKPLAAAMKEVDSSIKIYGPDFSWYIEDAINDLFGGKNNIAGKVPGKSYYYCDGISWHKYPQDNNVNTNLAYAGIDEFKASIVKCKAKVDEANKQLGRTGEDALGWGLGEYNAKNGSYVHSWGNGQMFAGILNLCMQYEAKYATTWSMFENGGSRSGTDYSFIDGNGTPRATYRHMQMIAQNFSGTYLEGKSSKSDIIAFGSLNDKKISVMVLNRANASSSFNLNLNYTNINSTGGAALNIDGGSELSYKGSIEALATHIYVFDNGKITRTVYTSNDFLNDKGPVTTTL